MNNPFRRKQRPVVRNSAYPVGHPLNPPPVRVGPAGWELNWDCQEDGHLYQFGNVGCKVCGYHPSLNFFGQPIEEPEEPASQEDVDATVAGLEQLVRSLSRES